MTESQFVYHTNCEACGSSDGNAVFDDGHTHCFVCGKTVQGDGTAPSPASNQRRKPIDLIEVGEVYPLPKRKLSKETLEKFGYTVSTYKGEKVQVANYRDETGRLAWQHVRTAAKDFLTLGDHKGSLLYGQWLWRDGGKRIIITEGEIDAMSVSQAQGNKWPVVSLPKGAQHAKKAIKDNLQFLNKFEKVILAFDNDDAGRDAVDDVVTELPPGKVYIASLPLKDANDMLVAGRQEELISALWDAKQYRPDRIVTFSDIRDKAMKPIVMGLPWFLDPLTKLTYGRRPGEIYTLGAGTGAGKTDLLTEQVMFDRKVLNEKVALFFFEQEPTETARRLAGKHARKTFHIPDTGWTQEEYEKAFDALAGEGDNIYLNDHFGVADWETLKSHIRYVYHTLGVRLIYIDHLTALADPSNEKESLETLMGELGGLVKEIPIIVHLVSHLTTPDGKPHEEGGRVTARHFKGSRAIGFWSHFMFGMERDQQAEDPAVRKITTFRVIKDRYTGRATGEVFYLGYDPEEGRLYHEPSPPQMGENYGFKDQSNFDNGAF